MGDQNHSNRAAKIGDAVHALVSGHAQRHFSNTPTLSRDVLDRRTTSHKHLVQLSLFQARWIAASLISILGLSNYQLAPLHATVATVNQRIGGAHP